MKLSIIAAVARNGAIGFQNRLLYWLPDDLRRFKQLTTGHTIVMGLNTYRSLPKGALPNRRNCVLTTSVSELPGCECFPSWQAFLASCGADEEVFVIGGAQVYRQAIAFAHRLCLTLVDDTPAEADAFFPDFSAWKETWREEHQPDERHAHRFAFVDFYKDSAAEEKTGIEENL